jgi:PAS domain S-box-containing protein/diguanylate cyclase (GGDEF)-like protein
MKTADAKPQQLRVLILDDQAADAELCEHELKRSGLRFVSRRVDSLAALETELDRFNPDLVLSDFTFPGESDGLRALETVRRKLPAVPFVFVSGTIGEERAVDAMKLGAADYVLKDRMGRLGPVVRQVLEHARLRGEVERTEAALRHSEARKAALIGAALDCVITMDHQGSILEFNRAAEATFGYDAVEVLGKPVADQFIPAPLRDRHRDGFARYLQTRSATILNRRVETSAIRRDGSEFPVELTIVRVGADEPPVFTAFLRDITDRKLQERRIERLSRIRALSSGISAAIVRFGNALDLLNEACRIAVEHGGFEIAWAGRYDPGTLDVIPVAWAGVGPEQFTRRSTSRADRPEGQGAIGQAIRSRQPVFVNDITLDTGVGGQRRQVAIQRGFRSLTALPLVVDGEVMAHVSLFAKEANFFNEEERALLTELAANVSLALSSMARQEKIGRLSRIRAVTGGINAAIVRSRNKQVLFYEACRIAVEHGGFGIAWIGEFNPAAMEVRPVASAGLEETSFLTHSTLLIQPDAPQGQSLIATVVRERRAVCNNDIVVDAGVGGKRRREAIRRGYRSAVTLPIIVEGQVTGTFSMFVKEANFFDDQEMALLTELAGNISFALESIVRREKIDKLSRIRALSGEISAAIARIGRKQELLEEAARIAAGSGGFPMVWIGLIDPVARELKPAAVAGALLDHVRDLKPSVRDDIPSGLGTNGRAFRERVPVVDNDMAANPAVGYTREEWLKHGIRAALSLPLLVEGEPVGVMGLYSTEQGYFDDEEAALFGQLASNVSFALESIARQEKIERLSRIRSVLGEINAAIVRIHDKQELFDEACRIAVEAGRFKFAWLGVVDRGTMQIRPVARSGADAGLHGSMQVPRPLTGGAPGELGPSAEAVLERKVVIVNDVQSDSRISRKQDHLERDVNSIAVLPLLVAGETVGVLGLYAREAGFFDDEEVTLLSELAGDISFALQTIESQEKLDYLSYYDALTGLPNRSLFIDRTGQQMRSRGGEPMMVALILINIERFRNINEAFGRRGGDELLTLVAQRLEKAFRGKDYIARIGADGFGVVVRGIRDAAAVVHIVEDQILGCFREPYLLDGHDLRVGAKAGVAMYPADGEDADALFRNAEAAMKKARESGDRYLFYAAEMNARAVQLLSLETRLRVAVEERQFVLHYQPKVGLGPGGEQYCGLEALIRWQPPRGPLVPPGTFIPLLEETGLILDAGKWALEQALADHRAWTARGLNAPRIAVNVSPIQLQQRDFADLVIGALHQNGDRPEALELEVTESLLMKDVEASIRKLAILRGVGVHIAMDDFGTGYSSLSYIARLPINSVKIDRSFINGMASSPQDMAIVTTIIALAHSLNLRVVAEGVETREQARLLALLKCDEAQGFLYSKPLPAAEIETLLRAQQPAKAAP